MSDNRENKILKQKKNQDKIRMKIRHISKNALNKVKIKDIYKTEFLKNSPPPPTLSSYGPLIMTIIMIITTTIIIIIRRPLA